MKKATDLYQQIFIFKAPLGRDPRAKGFKCV